MNAAVFTCRTLSTTDEEHREVPVAPTSTVPSYADSHLRSP